MEFRLDAETALAAGSWSNEKAFPVDVRTSSGPGHTGADRSFGMPVVSVGNCHQLREQSPVVLADAQDVLLILFRKVAAVLKQDAECSELPTADRIPDQFEFVEDLGPRSDYSPEREGCLVRRRRRRGSRGMRWLPGRSGIE